MSTWPDAAREDMYSGSILVTDERKSLETWLDYHRATLLRKCEGLTPEQLVTRSCPPSSLSLLGLIRHMTDVEGWFHDFDGDPAVPVYWQKDARDAAFGPLDPATADDDLVAFHASVARARAAAATRGLDELCPCPDCDEPASLRWVYQHMIEEYARHNGHADLVREAIDGSTGD